MKLIHLSDSHLGHSKYSALNGISGINQRELDVYAAFAKAIDNIIELEPDLLLHTGDLFDNVRPSNRAISFALEQILRLKAADIPLVIIAGNHSMPRMREVGSVFRIFELIGGVHPAYKGVHQKFMVKEVAINAVPHCLTEEDFKRALAEAAPDQSAKYNILMLHAGFRGIREFSMEEPGEQIVDQSELKGGFDYIALGHYHGYAKLLENAYYSGSTERFSFNELGGDKGFIEVDLTPAGPRAKFHPLNIRAMEEIAPLDAHDMGPDEVMEAIRAAVEDKDISGKIMRLKIKNISPVSFTSLDSKEIKRLTGPALHFEMRYEVDGEENALVMMDGAIQNLVKEFENYLDKVPLSNKLNRDDLLKAGKNYLNKAAAQVEAD
ncbi:MAG: exonuclease SbcCD subunit D [Actinomycetota bacterium]|nr:exonuclease SbcCD subunit D [Actinomycetota bacterium]